MREIIFVGNARDFHAMDWYRTIQRVCRDQEILFATDLIHSEGHARLVAPGDRIVDLFNVDRLLFKRQSFAGNTWRNLVKALATPMQVLRLKRLARRYPDATYHAHTMYYLWVCWLAGLRYIGSPQGAEVLVRPHRSRVYRFFAAKALRAADHLVVDSVNMQKGIERLSGRSATVLQYGIDVAAIRETEDPDHPRAAVVSIRGMYPGLRMERIIKSRDTSAPDQPLHLFYPFWEDGYREEIRKQLQPMDIDLGRLETKREMYRMLRSALLAVSIPISDSSPRSVYEAIFCGCCVAITYNPWIESVPACMRSRIVVVDLDDPTWLGKAIEQARAIVAVPYEPSQAALDMFDQERSMRVVANRFYRT